MQSKKLVNSEISFTISKYVCILNVYMYVEYMYVEYMYVFMNMYFVKYFRF